MAAGDTVLRIAACLGRGVLALSCAMAAAQAAPPPIEAFFADAVFSGATLSPDGRHVAMRVGAPGVRLRLAVLDLETMKPMVVASDPDRDIRMFDWVNDRRLVFNLGFELDRVGGTREGPGLFAVDIDGDRERKLMQTEGTWVTRPQNGPPLLHWAHHYLRRLGPRDSDEILVAMPEERSDEKIDYFSLRRMNTVNGRTWDVDTPLHTVDWTFDDRGELRAVRTREKGRVALRIRDGADGWKQVSESDWFGPGGIVPRHVGPDGTVYVEAGSDGKWAVYTLEADGKLAAKPLLVSKDFDLHPRFITHERRLLGLRILIDAEVTHWLDPEMQALQATIDALLPTTGNRIDVAWHGDSPWVLITAFADNQPDTAYAYHRDKRRLVKLGTTHPGLARQALGRSDFVHIPARDGQDIPAYLTLPPGNPAGRQPMVVLVHGGPWTRGGNWRFDPEVQFLASRGYAVLQPEFRGSTGFGSRHLESGFKEWGRAMQDDVADATRWAIAKGHADPRRITIAGASYGGYATLMGLIKDPELFRCGVEWVGVTDIGLMFSEAWSDMTADLRRYGLTRMIGDPKDDADALAAVSPARLARKITQPLLMAYGEFDSRVPLVHGERLRDALKPHNPQVEWVVYEKEGHGWSRPETRVDFWGRVEKFLARNLATTP